MRAIDSCKLSYLLLLVSTIPAGAGALLPSTVLSIQSNQSLDLETPSPNSALSGPPSPFPPRPPPFPPRPPAPPAPAPTTTPRLVCFGPGQEKALAVDLAACDSTMELLLHTPPGPMEPQVYSRNGAEGTQQVPKSWNAGNCQIMISERNMNIVSDTFRYVDIALAARRVMGDCVTQSKSAFGGFQYMGTEGFYALVNGVPLRPWPRPTGNVTGDGNGTNATPMAMGTAVEIALPTGVSGLVQGDRLDEDVELSMMMM